MLLAVTNPHMNTWITHPYALRSIVTTAEYTKILALAVGETLDLKRDFGNGVLKITRTEHY